MLKLKEGVVRRKIGKMGISVTQFAHDYGFKQQTLASWITGKRNPKRDGVFALANALKCQPEEIAEIVFTIEPVEGEEEKVIRDSRNQLIFYWNMLNEAQRESILGVMEAMVKARGK